MDVGQFSSETPSGSDDFQTQLERQSAVIMSLVKRPVTAAGDVLQGLRQITKAAADTLNVQRSSVWLYSESRDTIRCVDLYDRADQRHVQGIELCISDYPSYFSALEIERVIAATHPSTDVRTREFTERYLGPYRITSMLDAAIWIDGIIVGVLCNEHSGPARKWRVDERQFCASLADVVALTLEAYERKRADEQIKNRLELTKLIARLSARFINRPAEEIGEGVKESLQELGEFLGADRSYLAMVDAGPKARVSHSWTRGEEAERLAAPLIFPSIIERGRDGQVVRIEDVREAIAAGLLEDPPEGTLLPASVVCVPLMHGDSPIGMFGLDLDGESRDWFDETVSLLKIVADILMSALERKRAEHALRAMQFAVDRATDSVLWIGPDARIRYANEAACASLGYSREQLLALTVYEIAPSVTKSEWPSRWEEVKRVGSLTYESEHRGKHGTLIPVEITLNYFGFEGREYHYVIARNIVERKESQRALRESERRFRSAFDYAAVGMALVAPDGSFVRVNRALSEFLGLNEHQLMSRDVHSITHVDDRDLDKKALSELFQGHRESYHVEKRFLHSSGEYRWGVVSVSLVRSDRGKPVHSIYQVQDVTQRRLTEEELSRERAFFRKVIDINPNFIFTKDRDGRFVLVNQAVADAYGTTVDEIIGKTDADFDPKLEEVEHFRRDDLEVMNSLQRKFVAEEKITDCTGKVRVLQTVKLPILGDDGVANLVLGVSTDITERKHAEEEQTRLLSQMQHSQKWESLGVLAGGIAHDFNNLLMGIMGNAGLASIELPKESAVQTRIDRINTAAKRAAELTNQLLAYSGKGQFVVQAVDITHVVKEMVTLLETIISKKATLHCEFATDLPAIEADITQLRQVVMNLITNASDALGDQKGAIAIRTASLNLTREYLSDTYLDDDLPEGEYVYLEISDTGIGMNSEVKQRIFDPFFTTKFTGRGLGLAAVLGIVRSHKGALKVESEPGKGTIFTVMFPSSTTLTVQKSAPKLLEAPLQGEGIILVVDDDDHTRSVARDMLDYLGFTVECARDGAEAVEIFKQDPTRFAAVLLDMTMPNMDGEETWRHMAQERPTVPVLFSSGYTEQEAFERFEEHQQLRFIQKPYNCEQLREALATLLADTGRAKAPRTQVGRGQNPK